MPFIGNKPSNNFVSLKRQDITGDGTASYTLDYKVASVNDILVYVNHVKQDPSSMTVSGTSLTMGGNVASTDDFYVIFLGQALQTVTPADSTITGAMLNDSLISDKTALTSAPADTDEFLVSDAGTIKRIDYSLIKGGGCWEKLVTTSISSAVAQVDFTSTYLTTTHLDYMIVASGIKNASDGQHLRYWVSTDGGSTFVSTGYANARRGHQDDADIVSAAQTGSSGLYFTPSSVGNSTGEIANFVSIFFDPLKQSNTTDNYLCILTDGVSIDTAGDTTRFYSGNMYPSTTAVNGIRLFVQSGNISSGSVTLYGRKV